MAIFGAPHRLQYIGSAQRSRDIVHAQAMAGEARRIDIHAQLAYLAAEHFDTCDTVDRGEQGQQLVLRNLANAREIELVGTQAIGGHRKHKGIHAPHIEAGAGRERRQYSGQFRLHLQGGDIQIAPPVKIERHLGTATAGRGTYFKQSRHALDRLFCGPGDLRDHLRRRLVSGFNGNRDAWKADARK